MAITDGLKLLNPGHRPEHLFYKSTILILLYCIFFFCISKKIKTFFYLRIYFKAAAALGLSGRIVDDFKRIVFDF